MLTTLKNMTKKLFLAAVVTASLSAASVAVYAQRCSAHVDTYSDGSTLWLSCGSSAGNFVYICGSGGCTDLPAYDSVANQLCAGGACAVAQ